MGKVGVNLRIVPNSEDVSLDSIIEEIRKKFEIEDSDIEEIGFGIKALKVLITKEDEGGTDDIENYINGIKGVEEVEVINVSLI